MLVKAVAGVRVPMEHSAHQYIEQEVVEVESSLYYQRRIADGDLVVVTATEKPAKNSKDKE